MKGSRKIFWGFIRIFFVVLALVPISYALYQQWAEIRFSLAAIDWIQALIGTVFMVTVQPLMGLIAWVILLDLGTRRPYLKVLSLYFISQVTKYLPGGIWAFPGRVVAYQAVGVGNVPSVISVVREVVALYLGAAVLGLLGLVQGLPVAEWVSITTGIGVGASLLMIVLTQVPWFWQTLRRIKFFRQFRASLLFGQRQTGLKWLLGALPVSFVYWLFTGVAFRELAIAVSPQLANLSWLHSASLFSLAWCAGFVVVIAPAGLGVRETALSFLLSSVIPLSEALSIALLARLWWTVAEAVYMILSLAWMAFNADLASILKPDSKKAQSG